MLSWPLVIKYFLAIWSARIFKISNFTLHFLFSAVYLSMKNCVNNVLDRCKNNTDPRNRTNTATRARALAVIGSENYYCKDGLLNSFNGVNLQPDCRKKATKKVKNCAASFHKEFREDKASSSLCRLVTDLGIVQSVNSPQVLLYSFLMLAMRIWRSTSFLVGWKRQDLCTG